MWDIYIFCYFEIHTDLNFFLICGVFSHRKIRLYTQPHAACGAYNLPLDQTLGPYILRIVSIGRLNK